MYSGISLSVKEGDECNTVGCMFEIKDRALLTALECVPVVAARLQEMHCRALTSDETSSVESCTKKIERGAKRSQHVTGVDLQIGLPWVL